MVVVVPNLKNSSMFPRPPIPREKPLEAAGRESQLRRQPEKPQRGGRGELGLLPFLGLECKCYGIFSTVLEVLFELVPYHEDHVMNNMIETFRD